MSDPKLNADPKKFMLTVIISFVVLFVFSMIMMLWHGSYEKDAPGKLHYNTRVIEPASGY
jgi:hypothetical protein